MWIWNVTEHTWIRKYIIRFFYNSGRMYSHFTRGMERTVRSITRPISESKIKLHTFHLAHTHTHTRTRCPFKRNRDEFAGDWLILCFYIYSNKEITMCYWVFRETNCSWKNKILSSWNLSTLNILSYIVIFTSFS